MDAVVENPDGTGGEPLEDRRAFARRRVFKGAILSFNKGYGALECVVRNESENGALLSFGETSAVPPAFDLAVKGGETVRHARVRWRTLSVVGVEFV
jgi:hypothetical protein